MRSGARRSRRWARLDSQSAKTTESGGPRGCDGGKKVKGHSEARLVAIPIGESPAGAILSVAP